MPKSVKFLIIMHILAKELDGREQIEPSLGRQELTIKHRKSDETAREMDDNPNLAIPVILNTSRLVYCWHLFGTEVP